MTKFTMHTPEAAPEASRHSLLEAKKSFNFVPNVFAGMAESPAALKGYLIVSDLFAKTRLSPVEQQVVLLATSIENESEYSVGMQTVIAKNTAKVPAPIIEALRSGGKLPDPKLDALASFARTVVRKRGWIDEAVVKTFIGAGYDRAQLLDVLLGIWTNILANYANHIMGTTLDKEFESGRWARPRKAA
jgi:alkylhydroperoxidase family enzyme